MDNPLSETEQIAQIEKEDISSFEEAEPTQRERLIIEASRKPFWNEVLIPDLNHAIAMFDGFLSTEVDPWRRYALVEAYKAMSNFKLQYLDVLERAQRHE